MKKTDEISFFRWSAVNILGFALGGVVASLLFPLIFIAALFAGILTLFLYIMIAPAVVGALIGMIIGGFAGYAQVQALKGRSPQSVHWTGQSIKGGLLGGAFAGTVGIFQLTGSTSAPLTDNVGGGPGSFFPVNWLFWMSPRTVILLALAGTITGFFVGRQQQQAIEKTKHWAFWSALGWGLGWGVTAILAESLLKATGLESITNPAVNGSFENWPAQLAAAALSLGLCGLVYALVTFWPLAAADEL